VTHKFEVKLDQERNAKRHIVFTESVIFRVVQEFNLNNFFLLFALMYLQNAVAHPLFNRVWEW